MFTSFINVRLHRYAEFSIFVTASCRRIARVKLFFIISCWLYNQSCKNHTSSLFPPGRPVTPTGYPLICPTWPRLLSAVTVSCHTGFGLVLHAIIISKLTSKIKALWTIQRCSAWAFLDYASIFFGIFWENEHFFLFFLEKELLAFAVILHDCDPDFSTQKDK